MSKTLYRDLGKGKIAGVCAGIAEYLNLDIVWVRVVIVLISFIGFGFFVVIAYIAAVLLIEKKPEETTPNETQRDSQARKYPSSQECLVDIDTKMKEMEKDVMKMEAYVTSSEFELNRKFKNL